MKKCFTLLMAALIVSVAAQNARADEIVYKSLGMGWMTDDMVTQLLDWQPVTYQVEIMQAEDDSPFYRVVSPYGKAFADEIEKVNNKILTPEQYDSEGKCYIDIDASDPDNVIFHKTMTGFDLGTGEVFIGVNSSYNVVFRDGKFTAPMLGIAVGMGESAIAANRRGKFRIVLPGIELSDYIMSIEPASQCLTERTFKATLSVGADIAEVRYAVFPNMLEDEMIGHVRLVTESGATFGPRGEFSYEMDEVNKETIVLVGLDRDGERVGYVWCSYYFIDEDPDGWTDCGDAEFTDGILQDLISNIPSQTTRCMLQQSKAEPTRYRLVDPYSGLDEYAALNAKHKDHHHYIYINAGTPECIYIEESPIGMESGQYGLMRVNSYVNYFLCVGYDIEECIETGMGAVIEDGVMTFPEDALQFSMLNYDDGDWYSVNTKQETRIVLPEGFDITSSVANVAVDNNIDAPAEYYDLQGVKISNPQSGKLYIKRQGSTVSKLIVR